MSTLARLAGLTTALALTAAVGMVGVAGPAGATTTSSTAVTAAAAAFQAGESVYVDPAAEIYLSPADADQLRAQIRDTGYPFYAAVLPRSAAVNGSSNATLRAIASATRLDGAYMVYLSDGTANAFDGGDTATPVGALAAEIEATYVDQGAFTVMSEFVTAAAPVVTGGAGTGSTGGSTDSGSTSGSGGGGSGFLWLLGFGALAAGGIWWARRQSRKALAQRTLAVRRTVDEDVTQFGEEVVRLDLADPQLDEAGRADAQRALDSYERAKGFAATMERPEDAQRVTTELEEGRFALASATARAEGLPLPERRPPCFVDPRHGPSAEDVQWAPDGGAPRPIPVCAACATTLRAGMLPAAREIEMDGRRMPYWQGGQTYAPYAGGYFASAGANMLPMIFMGTMMGSMFASPTVINQVDPGASGGFGGGDFGGGGWGGGDFGGGGFDGGGGDF